MPKACMVVMALILGVSGSARGEDPGFAQMAEDGSPLVTVVVSDSAGKCTKFACADLVRCLSKALGVEVPVASRISEAKTRGMILVGDDIGLQWAAVMPSELQRDGCAIWPWGEATVISGNSDQGIANGVYTFLIDHVGVRWFAPGDLYEVVPYNPKLHHPTSGVTKKNPDLAYRFLSGIFGDERAWERRNRLDTDAARLPGYGFGHALYLIFPPSVYAKEHPEYYALIDGKRHVPTDPEDQTQPCFTNPDVIRLTAEAAKSAFDRNPDLTTFSICVNDSGWFCRCANCAALDEPMRHSRSGWPIHSDSYFHFVREVAKLVEKTNPGKSLGCYAYWCTELPPRGVDKLPANVVIELTQDTSQHFDPDYKAADRELWAAWRNITDKLGQYDYHGLGWLTPRFYPHIAADDIKFLKSTGAAGFYCEAYPNWAVTGPQIYLDARLLWDSSLDPDAVLDEYYTTLYGPAAPEVRKFYATLEKYWARSRKGKWFQGLNDMAAELSIADADLIEEAWQCLFRAKPLVIGRESERVIALEDRFKLSYYLVKGYAQARKVADWQITGQDDLALLVGEALKALEYVRLAEKAREVWSADPLYRNVYYTTATMNGKIAAWEAEVRLGVQTALDRIGAYCSSKLPEDQRETVWKDLRDRLVSDETAKRLGIADSKPAK